MPLNCSSQGIPFAVNVTLPHSPARFGQPVSGLEAAARIRFVPGTEPSVQVVDASPKPFVLVAAGWSALLLAAFYWIIEIRGWRRWAEPFVWIGLNPIIIYVGGNMIDWPKIAARFTGGDLQKWLNSTAHPGVGDLLTAVVAMGFSVLLAWFLHRKKLYLRA